MRRAGTPAIRSDVLSPHGNTILVLQCSGIRIGRIVLTANTTLTDSSANACAKDSACSSVRNGSNNSSASSTNHTICGGGGASELAYGVQRPPWKPLRAPYPTMRGTDTYRQAISHAGVSSQCFQQRGFAAPLRADDTDIATGEGYRRLSQVDAIVGKSKSNALRCVVGHSPVFTCRGVAR